MRRRDPIRVRIRAARRAIARRDLARAHFHLADARKHCTNPVHPIISSANTATAAALLLVGVLLMRRRRAQARRALQQLLDGKGRAVLKRRMRRGRR